MKWDTCVKDYLKMVENGCPEEFRPTWCKHCQSKAKFHKHGSFTRSVLTMEELLSLVSRQERHRRSSRFFR